MTFNYSLFIKVDNEYNMMLILHKVIDIKPFHFDS